MSAINVLYFSRGRGYGHAAADLELAAELPGCRITFASYGSGAEAFRRRKANVIDLGLPESNPFLATQSTAYRLADSLKPDIVVAREEFGALPAAALAGIPSIFLSDWLPPEGTIAMEALAFADSILVLESAGIFALPAPLRSRTSFLGTVRGRHLDGLPSRAAVRAKLNWDEGSAVFLVIPGGWLTEERAPLADLAFEAFGQVDLPAKALVWITGKDRDFLNRRKGNRPGIMIVDFVESIGEYIVGSDLVLTKGTRGSVLDAAILGIPSISLSHRSNPIDELLVGRVHSNLPLNAAATEASVLAGYMRDRLGRTPVPRPPCTSVESAAGILRAEIGRVLGASARPDKTPAEQGHDTLAARTGLW